MPPAELTVVVPTFKRPAFLRLLLRSLARARPSPRLHVEVIVVDNGSRDRTRDVVSSTFGGPIAGRVRYLLEPRAGKSHALNAGIRASTGDLVALLDDDEIVDPGWFEAIASAFDRPWVDFISGRCLPVWPVAPPRWLPGRYPAVVGAVDGGSEEREFETQYDGTLSGGNSVIRRAALMRVGLFSPHLGPRADMRLLCCEDEDMYLRLIATGARGLYVPALTVHHYVHLERLSRRYHRRWCFWRGVSKALLRRELTEDVPHVAGVPRFLVGAAARGAATIARRPFGWRDGRRRFDAELALWDLAGFVYGRHFYRVPTIHGATLTDAVEDPGCRVAAAG